MLLIPRGNSKSIKIKDIERYYFFISQKFKAEFEELYSKEWLKRLLVEQVNSKYITTVAGQKDYLKRKVK